MRQSFRGFRKQKEWPEQACGTNRKEGQQFPTATKQPNWKHNLSLQPTTNNKSLRHKGYHSRCLQLAGSWSAIPASISLQSENSDPSLETILCLKFFPFDMIINFLMWLIFISSSSHSFANSISSTAVFTKCNSSRIARYLRP